MSDKRVFLACLHSLLLFATIFAFFSSFSVSYAAIINVPQQYPTIQQAIDAAGVGDTINVSRRAGESQSVYYERLTIDKQLILQGESRETTIIDGSGGGSVIRILADSVEIRNFTVRNGGSKYSGIRANGYSYLTIANNTVKASKNGIFLLNSYYNTIVQNLLSNNSAVGVSLSESLGNNINYNNVSNSAHGIKLYSTNTTYIVNNTVADNSYGIYVERSENNTIDGNILQRNTVNGILPYHCYDITVSDNDVSESAYGIELYNSNTITVLNNKATNNSYGVYLAYSDPSNTIENNTISRNDWGVTLYSSSSNTLRGNTISYNTYGVDPVTDANNNLIYHNNFVQNAEQAVWNPDCVNTWDNGYPSGGNYWSDYTGTDSDGDGIGDTAYSIDPMNRDRYPLMLPFGTKIHDVAIIGITLSDTTVLRGELVYIDVTVKNGGHYTESFNVTVYADKNKIVVGDEIIVGNQTVNNLAPGTSQTLNFEWDTTVTPMGFYWISAEASPVPEETNTDDNVLINGIVQVRVGILSELWESCGRSSYVFEKA